MNRCKLALGNNRFVQVVEWKGELRVDLRQWENNYPSKKGVSLNLMQYKNLLAALDLTITPAFTNDQKELQFKAAKNGSHHLGANVFVSARQDNPCVDIRQYWKPSNYTTIVPTKRGLCLRPTEFKALQSYISDIEKLLPELKDVIPCYMRDDHSNQLGMMSCKNCNPNEFYKWWITFTFFFPLLRCKNCITDVFILILATCYKWTG